MTERKLGVLVVLALIATAAFGAVAGAPYVITLATKVAILGLAGVGLNLAIGSGGMVSFGHAAFFGVGGYVTGILASTALNYDVLANWPVEIPGTTQMLIHWPIAIVMSALVALIIGALSLRTSGVYFIMITLAFAQMIYYFAISWPAYGGEDGLSIYVRSSFPGVNTLDPISFFGLACGVLVIVLLGVARVMRSPFGLALEAVRQNPVRATAMGLDRYRLQLLAFVISGAITGLAGALYADLNRFVSPSMLSWHTSGEIMVLVILGGVGRLVGPVAGAALFIVLEQVLGGWTEHWQLFLGLMLIGVVLYARGGIIGSLSERRRYG